MKLYVFAAVCLLRSIFVLAESMPDAPVPITAGFTRNFPYRTALFSDADYQFSLHHQVLNAEAANETLRLGLTLQTLRGARFADSWMGVGFGRYMLDAQFAVCHLGKALQGGPIELHEHISSGKYAPPVSLCRIPTYFICECSRYVF